MPKYSARDHIITGGGTIAARIIQLILGLTVVGLGAYGLVFLRFDGLEINMAAACLTVVGSIYFLAATTAVPKLYNYWFALAFDIVGFCLWVSGFGVLVNELRPFYRIYYEDYTGCDWIYYGRCFFKRDLQDMGVISKRATTSWYTYRNSMAAIAALAGIEWVVFFLTMVAVSMYIYQHRKEGGHARYSHYAHAPVTREHKHDVEMQPSSGRPSEATTEPGATYHPTAVGHGANGSGTTSNAV